MIKTCHTSSRLPVFILVMFGLLLCETTLKAQNTVGIGTSSPNPNAVLELVSPGGNQGLLVPRISTVERQGMVSSLGTSETGLIVFDTDLNQFFHWVDTVWVVGLGSFSDIAGGDLQGNYPNPTLRPDVVSSTTILDGSVTGQDVADNTITSGKIDPEGNTNAVLGTDAVGNPLWEPKSNFLGNSLPDGNIMIGDAANTATPRSVSGDISLANDGTVIISDNAITSSKILDDAITSSDIGSDAVANDELAPDAVTSTEIQDGTVSNQDLADNAVDGIKIQDNSIGAIDIATDAITSDEIASGAVGSDEIVDGTVNSIDIANDAVVSSKIADGTIAPDDIQSGGNNKVMITTAAGTVFWENISLFETSTLSEGSIFVGDVSNTAAPLSARGAGRILIGDGTSVQSLSMNGDISLSATGDAQINAGVVGSSEITDNSLTRDDIAPNAVEASELADNAVDNGALQDDAISTAKIQDDAITGQKIAADAIASAEIVDASITTVDISDNAVNPAKIDGEGSLNAVLTTDPAGNPQWESRSNFGTSSLPSANIFVGDAVGVSQAQPVTGDVTISNSGNIQINTDVIGTSEVIDNSLSRDDIGPNAIESSELADNAVDVGAIQSDAVTTVKITDDAVTLAKINGAGNNDAMLTTDGAGNPQWESKLSLDVDPTNEIQDLSLTGNTLGLTSDPSTVDLSGYLDNTDSQDLSLAGNNLSLTNDATPVDLSSYLDNTDSQDLVNVLGQGSTAGGSSITNVADPTNAQDVATKNYVDGLDAADTDGDPTNEIQDLSLTGNTLNLTSDPTTVDLTGYLDNTDNQDLSLAGNNLSLTNDATPVDLSSYLDNTDSQDLTNVLGQGNTAGGSSITNVANPTNAQDVATKNYVDNITITGANISNNSVSSSNIVNGSITSADIGVGEVANPNIQDGAVNSAKIEDFSIVDADISNGANITATKLQSSVMIEGEDVSLLNNDAGYLSSVNSSSISDGTIVDADISGSANIAASKLQSTVIVETENVSLLANDAGYLTSVTSADITNGSILNTDINASAAIDGTKINPNFGSQNIQTTGTLNSGAATFSSLTVTNLAGATDNYTGDGAVNSFTISPAGVFSSSDRRLKENIEQIPTALDKISMVEGKQYNFINDDQKEVHYGVIAQDLQKLFPHLVKKNQNGYLSVNYQELIPVLIEALKEQQNTIEQLTLALKQGQVLNEDLRAGLEQQQQLVRAQQFVLQQMQVDREALEKDINEIKQSLGLEAKK